jgi:hypothetical protein
MYEVALEWTIIFINKAAVVLKSVVVVIVSNVLIILNSPFPPSCP